MNAFVFSNPKTKGTDPWYDKNTTLVQAAMDRANVSTTNNNKKEVKS